MKKDYCIQTLSQTEIPQILPLLIQLADYHNQISLDFPDYYPLIPHEEHIREICSAVAADTAQVKGIFIKQQLTAFIQFSWNKSTGMIELLYVDENHRGFSLAKELMADALAFFEGQNIKDIQLKVLWENRRATEFYKRFGFVSRTIIMKKK